MDDEKNKAPQESTVDKTDERPVVKAQVYPLYVATRRCGLAVLDGGKQVSEEDQRLDAFAAFWEESCNDFDR
jgi:hypothetical protein